MASAITCVGLTEAIAAQKTGYYVDYADMLADAVTMKELNIDSVRTAHNPSDIRWYAICNRMGITLVDEANVEAHQHDAIFNLGAPNEEAHASNRFGACAEYGST